MNPLMSLLGQQAGAPAASAPGVQYDEFGNMIGIGVSGATTRPQQAVDPEGGSLPNVRDLMNVQKDVSESEEASVRKGMFGVKGTLRDILGLVGDAFLVQGGRNPVYAPQRQREREGDALAGFTRGGEDALAAAERLAQINPDAGRDFLKEAQATDLRTAQQESLAAGRKDMAANREAGRYDKARPALTALFNQPGAYLEDGSVNPVAIQMAERIAQRYGFTLEDFVNDNMSAEEAQLFAGSGATTYQQERLLDADRTADQRDFSNQTGRINATRPRAAPRPRAATDREEAIRIGNKPESERTPGERAFYEKYTRPPSSGSAPRQPRRPNKITVGGRSFTVKEN